MIEKNVLADYSSKVFDPVIDPMSYVQPLAAVIGHVFIGKNVMVSPTACVRGDEGQPLYIGDNSNVQDGVVIHALETEMNGNPIEKNLFETDGKKYAVYVGNRVFLANQVHIHVQAVVLDETFVGMKVLVFRSFVGSGCFIEPGVILMGLKIPNYRYVPVGSLVSKQAQADALPEITEDYRLKYLNKGVFHVNTHLAKGYLAANR